MSDKIVQAHLNKLRKDKFLLILTIPNVLRGINTRNAREDALLNLDSLQFSVYDIIIPPSAIPEEPLHYAGQNYNVTTYNRPPYAPVRISFEVDNEFKNFWVLWKWMQLINDPLESTYAGKQIFPNGQPITVPHWYNYQTNIEVLAKDEYNNDKAAFTFKYAFITRLGELTYNYRQSEQLGCFFEFVFNQLDMHLV